MAGKGKMMRDFDRAASAIASRQLAASPSTGPVLLEEPLISCAASACACWKGYAKHGSILTMN